MRGGVMDIEVVPRFLINGVYYAAGELPEEKVKQIVNDRIDMAFSNVKYEKKNHLDSKK